MSGAISSCVHPMLSVLELQNFIPPTPPAPCEVTGKDLQALAVAIKDLLEQRPQVGFAGMHIWDSNYDSGLHQSRRAYMTDTCGYQ